MTRFDPTSVFPFFVLFIVMVGVFYANVSKQRFLNQSIAQSSPNPSPAFEAQNPQIVSPQPTQTPSLTSSAKPAFHPLNTSQPTSSSSKDINDFKYPNANNKDSSSTFLHLETADSPNTVTEWYKTKIKNLGLNTQSFVVTNSNNNVNNSLSASGNGLNIKVEIIKSEPSKLTTIKVTKE